MKEDVMASPPTQSNAEILSLIGKDKDDVALISVICQDGLVAIKDIVFDQSENCFMLVFNRYRRESALQIDKTDDTKVERVLAGLRIDHIIKVKKRGFSKQQQERFLYILALEASRQKDHNQTKHEKENHIISLYFAENCAINLYVEEISITLRDLSKPWPGTMEPKHSMI